MSLGAILICAHERIFNLTWRQILQCAMGTLCVVKLDVGGKAMLEICLSCIILPIQIFLLECDKEGFSNGIVMRSSQIGKRLYYDVLVEQRYIELPGHCKK